MYVLQNAIEAIHRHSLGVIHQASCKNSSCEINGPVWFLDNFHRQIKSTQNFPGM